MDNPLGLNHIDTWHNAQRLAISGKYNIDVTFWSCDCPEIPHAISNMLNKKDSNAR